MAESYSDIDRWSQDYSPKAGQTPGPEVIPDGQYDFEIVSAQLSKTPKTGETIFRLELRVLGGQYDGKQFERVSFFRSQAQLDYLGGEMCKLGFDAEFWGQRGKPWSAELQAVLPRFRGKKFRGTRQDQQGDDRTFANLFIDTLISSKPLSAKELDKSIPY